MTPESHVPPLPVDVCAIESALVQVTVPPTATLIGFGEYAVVDSADEPLTIDALTVAGFGVVGVGVVEDDPQPYESAKRIVAAVMRNNIRASGLDPSQGACRIAKREFRPMCPRVVAIARSAR